MPSYSLSEIDALARKATRGAGYSWGIAEEVGKSVRWLSAYGLPGPEVLANYLQLISGDYEISIPELSKATDETSVKTLKFENNEQALCPIYCGTLINDLGHHLNNNEIISFNNMLFPVLALPAAARTAESFDLAISYSYGQTTILCNANGIAIKDTPHLLSDIETSKKQDGIEEIKSSEVTCNRTVNDFESTDFPSPHSQTIKKDALLILEALAHKTYAPDSEESRLKGAG